MKYPDYLVHFNRNHDTKTGQFAPGDGDGDGVSNDHANRSKKSSAKTKKIKGMSKKTSDAVVGGVVLGGAVLGAAALVAPIVIEFIEDVQYDKQVRLDYEEEQRAKQFVDDQRRASTAKFAGGDW